MDVKEEILSLTNEMKKQIADNDLDYLETLEQLKEKVEILGNEQVQKKFNGVENFIMNNDLSIKENCDSALNFIEYFEGSVEKNYLKDNGEMLPTTEKMVNALKDRNQIEVAMCSQEFYAYMKTLKDSVKVGLINEKISLILSVINEKGINNLTDDEVSELIGLTNELSDIMNDKFIVENQDKSIPNDLVKTRVEMDQILGKSLFEGVENEYEFGISYQLDDYEVDRFQVLRSELKELLKDEVNNKEKIDDIRVEMFTILGIDPFTYKDNKKIIDELVEPNKSRFEELKKKHNKLMEEKLKKIKSEKDINSEPVVPTKDNDKEKETTDLISVPPEPKPVPTPEKEDKKRRKVNVVKSAKAFYRNHKKAILLVGGLVLSSVLLPQLLPSIMYMNSILWSKVAMGSATQTVLHNINLLIGSKIGASYASASGLWTLSNGALLNATAAEASLFAAIGKVTLLTSMVVPAPVITIKKAIKLAREKLTKHKNKRQNLKENEAENKTNIFTTARDAFSKGYEKGKTKFTEKWEEHKKKKEDAGILKFYRDDITERVNDRVNYLIDKGFINEEQRRLLETLDKDKFMEMFESLDRGFETKDINLMYPNLNYQSEKVVDEQEKNAGVTLNELDQDVEDYINYAQETGMYTERDVEVIKKLSPVELRRLLENDPSFIEFKEYLNDVEERKGKGMH